MAQRTGALVFDERTDRYDIRFDLNTYYGGLHCGECFDVFVRGKWKPTRIEYGDKDNADTIVGNCDTTLFLGGKEKTTLKEISEILGKETIDSFNTSETRGRELSHGLNYQKLGKQLMTEDEIAVMDGGKCILQLRGVRPFFSDKFDITKHPKYKYLSDADPKNAFDMEKHLKRRPAIVKPDEVFDYYEIDAADLQEDADHEET